MGGCVSREAENELPPVIIDMISLPMRNPATGVIQEKPFAWFLEKSDGSKVAVLSSATGGLSESQWGILKKLLESVHVKEFSFVTTDAGTVGFYVSIPQTELFQSTPYGQYILPTIPNFYSDLVPNLMVWKKDEFLVDPTLFDFEITGAAVRAGCNIYGSIQGAYLRIEGKNKRDTFGLVFPDDGLLKNVSVTSTRVVATNKNGEVLVVTSHANRTNHGIYHTTKFGVNVIWTATVGDSGVTDAETFVCLENDLILLIAKQCIDLLDMNAWTIRRVCDHHIPAIAWYMDGPKCLVALQAPQQEVVQQYKTKRILLD